ncbi:MAG: hypothetical protein AB1345_01950 [Chloroflexota bacterium]
MKNAHYSQLIISLVFLMILIVACSSVSPERGEIVEWASQIARIEKQLEYETTYFQPLLDRITSRPPTNDELDQLTEYNNRITALYNEISNIYVPQKARSVHALFVENYAKISDTARYYVFAIKMNDLSYFDKSVLAAQEANRIGSEAYYAFEDLLDRYSISCREIDFCE